MSCPARPGPPLIQSARPDPKPLPDAPASDRPSLAAWHAGWAVAVALLALGGRWIGGIDGSVFYGVLAMVVPGLSGLVLLRRDGGKFQRLCEQLPHGALALLVGGSPCQDLSPMGPR